MGSAYYEVLDPRFARLFNGNAHVEKLYTGCRWAEGPAWFAAGRYLVWSDIPNNRMLRYDETDGWVSVFRQPCGNTNGNTVDRQGRLVTCEHAGRRVSRTEYDGSIVTIADKWQGKRLNSPNDAVVKSDGSIWFTDPAYGIESDYEGDKAESEIGACHVYRVDPARGEVDAVITDMVRPNGIAFSLDEKQLYVADTGRTHGAHHPAHIRVFDVDGDGKVTRRPGLRRLHGRAVRRLPAGRRGPHLDQRRRRRPLLRSGRHADRQGQGAGGRRQLSVRRRQAQLLYICGTTSLYAVRLMVNGAKTY